MKPLIDIPTYHWSKPTAGDYTDFLRSKVKLAKDQGVTCQPGECNPRLKPHQQLIVEWMVKGGRRACFASFGLGKSVIQLETVRLVLSKTGGRGLIVIPLGVRQEFRRDAVEILGWPEPPKFIRSIEEAGETGIYLTNYETIRDGKLDPAHFQCASLDEAAVLRGFGGTKTFREFMRLFTGDAGPAAAMRGVCNRDGMVNYRFVATATPSPNEYIELLAYAEFLGVMDVSQAKTRFFKRDSTKADKLTLHPHKEREFWLWVSSWALFVQRPEDLGCDGAAYVLPEMRVKWHDVPTNHSGAGFEKSGQAKMFRDAAIGVQDAASEKRVSLPARVAKLREIIQEMRQLDGTLSDQLVVWCDLNDEQEAVEAALREDGVSFSSVYGHMSPEEKEEYLAAWIGKKTSVFVSKPVMHGAGVNLQQCHTMAFLGIGFKFYSFIQAIHRIVRFLQRYPCDIHIIYSEAENTIKRELERKWSQHNKLVDQMTEIMKEFGLSQAAMAQQLTRKLGVERVESIGDRYRLVNNDCVLEAQRLEENSVHLVLTSIPFSTQYEYSPNYADFGHSEGNEEFFKQMDFLTPELLRALKPGRIAAIHVKDRIVPGGMTGLGYQTVYPFHARCIEHYTKHGFGYMGMKTIVTDVVRENNQTYRLGWTEQCKDATKMGVGMPEYLLLFRKRPSDNSDSYADEPVKKSKEKYSRSRWQIDAHGFTRSNGNRLLKPEEIATLPHSDIFKIFRDYSLNQVYDFEHHVRVGEEIDAHGRLPVTFMLLQPQSWSDEVWTDITRMLTLNGSQAAKGKEMHLCPMQFDIADRVIEQFSQKDELVLDPFSGLGTVPYRAILKCRRGLGFELNPAYFADACTYCKAAENEVMMPSLIDLGDSDQDQEVIRV